MAHDPVRLELIKNAIGSVVDEMVLTPTRVRTSIVSARCGIVGRVSQVQNRREQMKAMIRAVLRSTELILKNEAEVVAYIQKDFGLETKIAVDSYKILLKVLNPDGDIDDATLKAIIDKIRQESGLAAEISADRLVDLSILREVKAELRKR